MNSSRETNPAILLWYEHQCSNKDKQPSSQPGRYQEVESPSFFSHAFQNHLDWAHWITYTLLFILPPYQALQSLCLFFKGYSLFLLMTFLVISNNMWNDGNFLSIECHALFTLTALTVWLRYRLQVYKQVATHYWVSMEIVMSGQRRRHKSCDLVAFQLLVFTFILLCVVRLKQVEEIKLQCAI